MEAPKSWSQCRGLPGLLALWGNKASYKPHRREVQEASSGSGGFDGRQPVLPAYAFAFLIGCGNNKRLVGLMCSYEHMLCGSLPRRFRTSLTSSWLRGACSLAIIYFGGSEFFETVSLIRGFTIRFGNFFLYLLIDETQRCCLVLCCLG
jgi:hypothetical protein